MLEISCKFSTEKVRLVSIPTAGGVPVSLTAPLFIELISGSGAFTTPDNTNPLTSDFTAEVSGDVTYKITGFISKIDPTAKLEDTILVHFGDIEADNLGLGVTVVPR